MHAGCTIAPVDVPDLELCRVAHSVTVSSEAIQRSRWALNNRQFYRQLGPDVRITFAAAKFFTAADYVQAQCIRRRMTANLAHACKKTDILVTPATPCTAPVCHAAALRCGESDLRMVSQLMKYMQLSNFIGAPAVVVPVGLDDTGLPIGYALCHFFGVKREPAIMASRSGMHAYFRTGSDLAKRRGEQSLLPLLRIAGGLLSMFWHQWAMCPVL
jgi:Asp-tRNA(Asn)/Glu-tRNA(Gln) amidotransferase A subunit family amidase